MKNDHPAGPLDFDVSRREMLKQAGLVSVGLAATPVPGWPASWFKQEVTVVPFTDMANY